MFDNLSIEEIEDVKDGKIYTRGKIQALAESRRAAGVKGQSQVTAGRTTLERAILTGSVLRGTRQENFRLLVALGNQRSERLAALL